MIRNRELQKVAGDSFMAQDRTRVLYGRANVKVFRLRVVSGNEIETAVVFIINAGRIHKAAGARRLERLGQLPDFKSSEIRRQSNEMVSFQEVNHLGLAAFISLQERGLIFR